MAKGQQERKEVQTTGDAPMPAFMKKDRGAGMENVGSGDYEMPRIKLIQGISDELQTYNDLKAGDFFHALLEKNLGPELLMVPVYVSKRYVLWRPREDGGGILARADDAIHWEPADAEFKVFIDKGRTKQVTWRTAKTVGESGLDKWGTYDPGNPNSPPAATLAYVIVAAFPQHPECSPAALLLQRSSIPPARKLLGKLKISGNPIYGSLFNMVSIQDQNRNNDNFANYRFTAAGFVQDEAAYNEYKAMYENFARTGVQVRDMESAQDEMPGGEARDTTAAAGEGRF